MKVNSLKLRNYRCFETLSLDFNERLTVLVGANGAGKTTVLDGLAAILEQSTLPAGVGFTHTAPYLKSKDVQNTVYGGLHENAQLEAELTIASTEAHRSITLSPNLGDDLEANGVITAPPQMTELKKMHTEVLSDPVSSSVLPVFAYYRSTRNISSVAGVKNNTDNQFNRLQVYKTAADAYANYDQVASWLYDVFVEDFFVRESGNSNYIHEDRSGISEKTHIYHAVSRMIPEVNEITFTSKSPRKLLLKWKTPEGVEDRLVSQLSDGYRNVLALVMDFARRMIQANPQLDDPLSAEAVLLIDEVELHLHPAWQQQILRDLQKTFPNTQIICSTHSPQVVSTVKPEKLRILSGQELVPTEHKHTYGVSSGQILNDIFGIASFPEITEIESLKQQWMHCIESNNFDTEDAKQLEGQLVSWLGTESSFIINCRVDIAKRRRAAG